MSAEKTALIIGSAPIAYVAACVEEIAAAYDRVIVVAKGEPGQGLERDTVTVRSFEGQLNVSNAALAKAILTSRPDAVYIVYGSWLGHNHIFIAVNFYMALLLKRYKAYLFSRSAQEVDLKKRISHPFTRVDLGLSLVHWLFLPLYLFVRLLGPLLRIRFEPMRPSALGHYEELEIYLGMRYAGHVPPRTIDVFCYKDKPCNRQILKMFRTKILIIPWARYLLTWNHYIPGGEKHRLDLRPWDYSTLITQHDCKIAFSPEDRSRAVEQMKTMGLQEGESFVCLGFRDGMFDQQVRLGLYGNQEDANARRQLNLHAFRNADIANAECAVDYLTQQGHKVVRMGSIARPLPPAMGAKAFDYANWDGRNELLDIYLG
ncbi:MAG: TIGR04372 family glycosyltransferase, partial [Proteobacteria bacterium]|nr:TIGR04372 family glycosyltransferase [Pseudomonadota bacterium]